MKSLRIFFGILLLIGGAAFGLAQTAQLAGVVRDTSSANISGASVTLKNQKTSDTSAAKTNGSGLYVFSSVQPGIYTLTVSASGFQSEAVTGITVEVAGKVTRDVKLKIGAASDTVSVDGSGMTMNTVDASVSTVIDHRFVENLPLNGRSFQSLMTLAPGVTVVPSAGSGSSGEISVNGQRTEANYYTIDGISANTGATVSTSGTPGAGFSGSTPQGSALGTTQSIVSIDALEQFRATTSSYSAEYGRTPGGQFSFSTRSGTNDWHGSAFDYLRNTVLDAMNVFDTTKLPERQNDFGGTLGGPIRIPHLYDGRNKSFFFFSYEGLRLTSPQSSTLYNVPSNALRTSAPAALQPFLNAFPVPNGADLGNGLANFTSGYSAPSSLNTTSIRIDHSFGDRFKIFGRYSDVPSQSLSRQASSLSQVNNTIRNVKTFVFGADAVLTSSMANEFRVGLTGNDYNSNRYLDNFGGATPVALSTAPGLSNGDWMTFFMFYGLYPYYLIEPQSNRQRQFNLVDSMTQTIGRHNLKYGVDYRRLITSEKLPPLWEVAFFYNQASVLNNAPDGLYVYTQNVNMKSLAHNFSAFVQDEWKATDRLSISAGVRWDLNPPPTDANGNTPYTVNQITDLATTTAAPKGTALWKTTYGNFAPRIGIAYQIHQNPGYETTLRVGGGLFYDTGTALSAQGYYGIGTTGFASYTAPFPATLQQVQAAPTPNANAPYNAPIYAYDPNLKQPYTGQWNLAIEQGLGDRQSLTVNYVASAGRRLLVQRFYHPEAYGNTAFSQGKGLYITNNAATSDYNALQARFDRKLSHGLQALISYTWAHGFDSATTNFTVYELERGPSDYDIRQSFQAALSYDIGGHYNNALASYVLKHWSADARISARTALPVDVLRAATQDTSSGTSISFHPNYDRSKPLYVYGNQYPGGRAINYDAFDPDGTGEGNAGRNLARGFGATQTDLTLRRDFPFTERVGLQFRAEAYNVFNHPIYGSIYNSLSTGASLFGRTYNTLNNQLGGLSSLYQVGGPRSMQVSLKLHF
ncbi:MAG: TonB-dependent receptor [Edaphobacter sp.]|uniref:TonB-dependent receptor n=1 Tax=Edaphobacter sp. TaxID=1934404 RepID=UPI00239EFEFB|nr:carboxypeptidase regulatory-like domain-containing protein [Edaphobacter sp.]MDE1178185.1 TonB-dependent receptor [Edaphobacter sp.]